jgi:ketosteroid isomerase-like protein
MSNSSFLIALLLTVLFISCGCRTAGSKTGTDLEEAEQAISNSNRIYFQSFVKNDPSIFVDRYADDACIMPPDAPAMCGRDAALAFFRMAYDQIGLRDGKFITTRVYGLGEGFVTEEGLWQSFDAHNVLFDNGKFLVLWKKTPKGWKMFRDSFSSDRKKGMPAPSMSDSFIISSFTE